MKRRTLLGLVALAGSAQAGCSPVSNLTTPAVVTTPTAQSDFRGVALDPGRGYPLPDITLTDTTGALYSLRSGSAAKPVTQPVTVLFFGYSNCPDVCTGILADVASAMNRVSETERRGIRVVLITTDPARDTPEALRSYLERIDPNFVGLTGDLSVITAAAESVGVPVEDAQQLPSGGYEVTHGTQIIGFGRDNTAVVVWTYPTPIGDLAADFSTLVARSQ